jgi:hypothetical protein
MMPNPKGLLTPKSTNPIHYLFAQENNENSDFWSNRGISQRLRVFTFLSEKKQQETKKHYS